MIAFLGDGEARPLAGVPSHLVDRRAAELIESWWDAWQVQATNITPDGTVSADITAATPQNVIAWLESIGAVCVDIQAEDVQVFAGRSVVSLAAGEYLSSLRGVDLAPYQRLTIEQIVSTIQELIHHVHSGSQRTVDARAEQMASTRLEDRPLLQDIFSRQDAIQMNRLRELGFDIPDGDAGDELSPAAPVEDFSEIDREFGTGDAARGVARPFRFSN